jgi:hypothetical protein
LESVNHWFTFVVYLIKNSFYVRENKAPAVHGAKKMENTSIVKDLQERFAEVVKENTSKVKREECMLLAELGKCKFTMFSNSAQYKGETDNTVFYTYSEHYHANSPLWTDFEHVHHPHMDESDRGYIKGVATDFHTYLILVRAKSMSHSTAQTVEFQKNGLKKLNLTDKERAAVDTLSSNAVTRVDEEVKAAKERINAFLKEKTGCHLLCYLRDEMNIVKYV